MQQIFENYFNLQVLKAAFPDVLAGFWVTVRAAVLIIVMGVSGGLGLALLRFLRNRLLDAAIDHAGPAGVSDRHPADAAFCLHYADNRVSFPESG